MLKLVIAGNLGSDAEVKELGNNKTVINFSVAHTEVFHNEKKEKVERTHWVRCRVWNRNVKLAEYLKKGKSVICEGLPVANAYITKDGEAAGNVELNVHNLEFL